MSEELKPCPFCGGEAVKNSCAVAECKSCRSPVGCRACSIWKDSIDEWNTRVDDDENLSQYLGDLTAKLKLAVEALGDYEDVCHNCGENENQHDENGLVDKMDEYGRMVCGNPLYRVRKALKQIGEQL